ncbi:multicomponent Na+:H+ antiporter subunit E [Nonomuraea maritima]|uniref:Multicomponent Na+:H+ antiporter subunit E n=1 Tax=Nonomuraea maritima TaxID=683260 RepID=A0A1G8WQY0_9ACTN|nr:Na+/H+ antiporter subunit E [Nonomuraea maritima]SDJ80543.1 multicomponent Na+:H+ antiporter subunit E [Nonomuraea maritima]
MNRWWPAPRLLGRQVPLMMVAWLTLVWVTLWGDLSVGNVLGGLATAIVVTWLLPMPVTDPGIRIRPVALAGFLVTFGWDLIVSTARVVFWVAHPGQPPSQVVRVPLRTTSEAMVVLVLVALTTVPGSLVLEVYERELVLHVLGRPGDVADDIRADVAQVERRIVRAFGTRRDREELG